MDVSKYVCIETGVIPENTPASVVCGQHVASLVPLSQLQHSFLCSSNTRRQWPYHNFLPSPRCLHRFSGRIPNWTLVWTKIFSPLLSDFIFIFNSIKRGMFFVSHNLQKSLLFPTKKYCTWPICCTFCIYFLTLAQRVAYGIVLQTITRL